MRVETVQFKLVLVIGGLIASCGPMGQDRQSYRGGAPQEASAVSPNETFEPQSISEQTEQTLPIEQGWAGQLNEKFPKVSAELAFLDEGIDFLRARLDLIGRAKHSIRLQTFTIYDDETGRIIASALIDRARAGVDVRLILDPVQNFSLPRQRLYQTLLSEGVSIQGYAPLYSKFIDRILTESPSQLIEELNMRYHDKLLIIDAEQPDLATAITGGANIGNPYFRVLPDQPEGMWRDRDIKVRGAIVSHMRSVFDRTFDEFRQRYASGLADWATSILGAVANRRPLLDDPNLDQERLSWILSKLEVPLQLEWNEAKMRFVSSRPRFGEDFIHPTYAHKMQQAEQSIKILNSYFLPSEELLREIGNAVHRGVHVIILVNHAKAIDFPIVQTLTRSYYREILSHNSQPGVKGRVDIYEWLGDAVLGNGEGQNHSKYALFDEQIGIVGSYNLDPRSQNFNSESVIVFESKSAAAPFSEEFNQFLTPDYSRMVSMEEAEGYFRPSDWRENLLLQLAKQVEWLL